MVRTGERAAQIRREADAVLHERGLLAIAQVLGETFVGGSYFYDLMVWRDLDLYIRAPGVSVVDFFALGAEVTGRFGAWKAFFTDSRTDDPAGLYWGVRLGDLSQGAWKFDIWAVDDLRFARTVRQAGELVNRLTPETREAILQIKERYRDDPRYRGTVTSASVYDAVLEHSVRTPAEFEAHIAASTS